MKDRFIICSTALIIILVLVIQPSPNLAAEDITKIGFVKGDSFTFILEEYNGTGHQYQLAYNKTLKKYLEVAVGSEFTITITNTTLDSDGIGYYYNGLFSNGTHTATDFIRFHPWMWALFTDWDFYETNYTASFDNQITAGKIDNYTLINGPEVFQLTVNYIKDPIDHLEGRFDKVTGMLLYMSWDASWIGGNRLKQQIRQKIFDPVANTITKTTSSTTNTSSDSLSTSTQLTSSSQTSINQSSSQSDSKNDSTLAGFELFWSYSALIAIIMVARSRKH